MSIQMQWLHYSDRILLWHSEHTLTSLHPFEMQQNSLHRGTKVYHYQDQTPVLAPMDLTGSNLYPSDASKNSLPRTFYGDGNCLFLTALSLVWDFEDHFTGIRLHACTALALNDIFYTDNTVPFQGMKAFKVSGTLQAYYVQYLEEFIMRELTPQSSNIFLR